MRLVFVLYAEDRDLLPSRRDDEARRIYDAGYSVRGLHARLTEDAALNPDTMDERRGGWGRLVALFRLIYAGHPSGFVRARRGGLFDPGRYPFLEGRAEAAEAPSVLKLADGCLLRILDGLLILKERGRPPERLSYRTLDVEQIGSVYETVMGFEARLAAGRSIAVKGAKGLPFFADLDALIAKKGKERVKAIKGETGLSLSGAKAAAVEAAADVDALAQALASSVDLRGSPGAVPLAAGSPILQPTDERRRSGSHYTPRSLTAPIVEHALAPAFERLGENAMPEQILDLKVCDPAMGSGAFLVEACRAIADRLVKAWEIHKGTRPAIPLDEDEALHARRLVAQRCLYGVDKNPRAVELAKLSLWLATLARDHEFTFLDHALKCGDSLVGLDLDQITAVHWDHSQAPTFVGRMVRQHLAEAEAERAKLRAHAEDATEAELRPMLRASEGKLEAARLVGDGVIAAFFSSDKPRARVQGLVQFQQDLLASGDWDVRARALGKTLREGPLPIPPFHWPVEFPEVFSRENAGFDAILGNPPFLSGSRTSQIFGSTYFQFLLTRFRGARHQCDIVAFFFRLAFELLRHGGSAGLIATNTLAQGDTRASSLEHMINEGATIYRVKKRLSWPGEAAVVVSPTHFIKGNFNPKLFDGRPVERISAFLLPGEVDTTPTALGSNPYFSKGSQIYGQGFVIDDNDATANPIAVLRFFSEAEKSFVFPVFGGIDLNQRSILSHEKWVINVSGIESEAELDHLSAISQLLRNTVKPERDLLPDNANNRPLKRRWWTYQAPRPELYKRLALKRRCIAHAEVSPHLAFRFVETGPVYIKTVIVIDSDADSTLAVLQSRAHELWARFFASSMKDDLRYTPSDCFRTFPFPEDFLTDSRLEAAGEAYHAYRAAVMIERDEGLTRTYNRFHDQREIAADFARLRELHAAMDCGVLTAYGWDDLAARAAPEFHPREDDPDKTRLDWPQAFKDEVLARLLDLNRTRAAEENALGLTAASEDDADANDDGVDED
ncbi:MAG TPA: DNA methyltransferase [Caulobacteraceae bacterium]